jgi:hypothetical protein
MSKVLSFARQYVEAIGGQYTDYDSSKAVIVVPLAGGRYQTVLGLVRKGLSGADQVVFVSKICEMEDSIDLKQLLISNAEFDHARFILEDGYLKVVAAALESSVSEPQVREIISEVASLADQFELKFTGQDVH